MMNKRNSAIGIGFGAAVLILLPRLFDESIGQGPDLGKQVQSNSVATKLWMLDYLKKGETPDFVNAGRGTAQRDPEVLAATKAFDTAGPDGKEKAAAERDRIYAQSSKNNARRYAAEFEKMQNAKQQMVEAETLYVMKVDYNWSTQTFKIAHVLYKEGLGGWPNTRVGIRPEGLSGGIPFDRSDQGFTGDYFFGDLGSYEQFTVGSADEADELFRKIKAGKRDQNSILTGLSYAVGWSRGPFCSSFRTGPYGQSEAYDYMIRVKSTGPHGSELFMPNLLLLQGYYTSFWDDVSESAYVKFIQPYVKYSEWVSRVADPALNRLTTPKKYKDPSDIRGLIASGSHPPSPRRFLEFRITSVEILSCEGAFLGAVRNNQFVPASKISGATLNSDGLRVMPHQSRTGHSQPRPNRLCKHPPFHIPV